jgi:hypothetical protein
VSCQPLLNTAQRHGYVGGKIQFHGLHQSRPPLAIAFPGGNDYSLAAYISILGFRPDDWTANSHYEMILKQKLETTFVISNFAFMSYRITL